ncbi:hypothetical protein DLAC_03355 [Tieghemostelium lacteum]|uniref:FNIP repeat-containing protein n=1 Tax=Tieghemostelium lacteum TaxID=361077 RepID=A0A152A256_TIELA|nr:hypothetical protein DLAC_03355 [Tieghemostelium lacteum]|eukprot:KYR00197.1 hypothetical protein DLAC_03355 [Tieghemostelium lacteum]
MFFSGKRDYLSEIPLKFRKVIIRNQKQYEIYHEEIKQRFDISDITYYWEGIKNLSISKDFVYPCVESLSFPVGSIVGISMEFLPKNLEYLHINNFNGRLELGKMERLETLIISNLSELKPGDLPPSLTRLNITGSINCIPDHSLPHQLKSLTMKLYGEFTEDTLPKSLLHLDLYSYMKSINHLPPNLTSLSLLPYGNSDWDMSPGVLPNSIKILKLGEVKSPQLGFLPLECRYLNIYYLRGPLDRHVLPDKLKELYIGAIVDVTLKYGVFPEGLEIISMNTQQTPLDINFKFPSTLKRLSLVGMFNQKLESLPVGLETLELGPSFNQPLNCLSGLLSLKTLNIGSAFNQILSVTSLPANLLHLTFGSGFNRSLFQGVLPNSLQTLALGTHFRQTESLIIIPNSLTCIRLPYLYEKTYKSFVPSHTKVIIIK